MMTIGGEQGRTARTPGVRSPGRRWLLGAAAAIVAIASAGVAAFHGATTFIGDDHLFLAFARYVPNPLVAFIRDQHGGEFYRPVPMLVWWVLGRLAGGAKWPFALFSFVLHAVVAAEVGTLIAAVHRGRRDPNQLESIPAHIRTGAIAGALFVLAPVTQEAAFWYSASTDLLATAFALGAVLALFGRRPVWSAALFALGCWSKESVIVAPALAAVALHASRPTIGITREPSERRPPIMTRLGGLLPVVAVYLLARTAVLGGLGTPSDQPAPALGKLLQIFSGLVHLVTGTVLAAETFAWSLGLGAWAVLLLVMARRAKRGGQLRMFFPWAPVAWVAIAVTPLIAAPWVVGARYFYLPAVGLAWLTAEALAHARRPLIIATVAALAGLASVQMLERRADVASYEARLSAARRAVAAGLDRGFSTFHIASGIKDIDLAVKSDGSFADHESRLVVLADVPASFIVVPDGRASELSFLLARPPLPPAGAYLFGDRRIVALARRGEDPTLDEVMERLPTIRFIRLRLGPAGHIIPRDMTETLMAPSSADE